SRRGGRRGAAPSLETRWAHGGSWWSELRPRTPPPCPPPQGGRECLSVPSPLAGEGREGGRRLARSLRHRIPPGATWLSLQNRVSRRLSVARGGGRGGRGGGLRRDPAGQLVGAV